MSESNLATKPYKGLVSYSEEDAPFFFGRGQKTEVIKDNLLASRLTVFYGPSGVGKSSVLRAGVTHRLLAEARQNLEDNEPPEYSVVAFSSWRDDPAASLINRVRESVEQQTGERCASQPLTQSTLTESLRLCSLCGTGGRKPGIDLLIILDQFEEYFLYHGERERHIFELDEQGRHEQLEKTEREKRLRDKENTFAFQLARAINTPDLRVNFLISIRDDSLSKLDFFKGLIYGLLDNRLSIEHLDEAAAREAIIGPLAKYNQIRAGSEHIAPLNTSAVQSAGSGQVGIEPELVTTILSQVKAGQVLLGQTGGGVVKGEGADASTTKTYVETPYLQLVLTRLWDEEQSIGSRVMRLETLKRLGGAENIVRTHLNQIMNDLSPEDKERASRIFYHLVTPSGTKIAHTVRDLLLFAGVAQNEPKQLTGLLDMLSDSPNRILRPFALPTDTLYEKRYEISHDVLAPAILDWRANYESRKLRAEAEREAEEAKKRAEREARSAKRLRYLVALLGLVTLLAAASTVLALTKQAEARKNRELATAAEARAKTDREIAEAAQATAHTAQQQADIANGKALEEQEKADIANKGAEAAIADAAIKTQRAREEKAKADKAVADARVAQQNVKDERARGMTVKTIADNIQSALRAYRESNRAGAISIYQGTIPLYRQLKDSCGEAAMLSSIGSLYKDLSSNDMSDEDVDEGARKNALENLNHALSVYKQCDSTFPADLSQQGETYSLLADLSSKENEPPTTSVLENYERALAFYKRADDIPREAQTLVTLGKIFTDSDPAKALTYSLQLPALYGKMKLPDAEAGAWIKAAQLYTTLKKVKEALDAYGAALSINRQLNSPVEVADNLLEIAKLNTEQNPQEAIKNYSEVLSIYESLSAQSKSSAIRYRIKRAEVLKKIGRIYSALDKQKAIEYYERALVIYREGMANYKALIDKPQSKAFVPRYVRSYNGYRLDEAATLYVLGGLYAAVKDTQKALESYIQALATSQELKQYELEVSILNGLGKLYESMGDKRKAEEFYRQAKEVKPPPPPATKTEDDSSVDEGP